MKKFSRRGLLGTAALAITLSLGLGGGMTSAQAESVSAR